MKPGVGEFKAKKYWWQALTGRKTGFEKLRGITLKGIWKRCGRINKKRSPLWEFLDNFTSLEDHERVITKPARYIGKLANNLIFT